jgi:predicted TIM-barrel fold metal-dependent hydrolase
LRRQFKEGARGIGEGGFPPYEDPKELKPVMDVVQEFDVPVLFHTGWSALQTTPSLNYSAAWRGAERMGILAAHYPQAKLVLAHIGGRFDHLDGYEMLRVAFTFDNVYVETSKSTPTLITEAVRGLGAERVVFGSDWNRPQMKTYGPKHFRDVYQHWYNLNQIAAADITEDERDMILYKNALRLLKISGS